MGQSPSLTRRFTVTWQTKRRVCHEARRPLSCGQRPSYAEKRDAEPTAFMPHEARANGKPTKPPKPHSRGCRCCEFSGSLKWTPKTGQPDKVYYPPVGAGEQEVSAMSRKRRVFGSAFKARVALAAVRGDRPTAQLASQFSVHTSQVTASLAACYSSLSGVSASCRASSALIMMREMATARPV